MANKSGFVSIIGKPNVGKSSLLNALLGEKVAIVSPKVQTTRHRITGVLTEDDTQYIFVDTPGMHTGYNLLGKTMDKKAASALLDVDVILYVVDRKFHESDQIIIDRIRNTKTKVILVINKIDQLPSKDQIDEIIISFLPKLTLESVIPISALNQTHLNHLKDAIKILFTDDIFYFDPSYKTDQTLPVRISELIRERLLHHLDEEIPHGIAVVIEKIADQDETRIEIDALIIVERDSQKGIVIGKDGLLLKKIKEEARRSVKKLTQKQVTINLWVKVKKDWRNQKGELNRFGYGD